MRPPIFEPEFTEDPMLFDRLPAIEADTHADYHNRLGGFTATDLGLAPNRPWGEGYYYPQETAKRAIVLHYTMGALQGDIPTLTNAGATPQGHVSVSCLVARSGRIYQLFDPAFWSYHLGRDTIGGNQACSSSTIGIELSNRGPLTLQAGTDVLVDAYGQAYCRLGQVEAYAELQAGYRGYTHFARFTAEQYEALAVLLPRLAERFGIPLQALPETTRFRAFSSAADALAYRGVCSHVNFRARGKTDIGPAFEWERLALPVLV